LGPRGVKQRPRETRKNRKRVRVRCEIRAYRSIFLLVCSSHALARQFPSFAHWHESGAEPESDHGAEEEASSVESNDDIDPLVGGGWYGHGHEVMNQVRDEGFETQRVAKNWQDVTKVYTLERSQRGAIRVDLHCVPFLENLRGF